MAAKTYKVKKILSSQSPPGRVLTLAVEPPTDPPTPDYIITDSTDNEWLMCNCAYPGTVTVDLDAAGNRTMSRP